MSTGIQWADETWNPVTGCSPISEGCANCWAARMANRLRGRHGYDQENPFGITFHPARLEQPSRWRKPRRIFVSSMGDLFHEDVPDEWIDRVFTTMTHPMGGATHHTYMILTKRPERVLRGHAERFAEWPNIWLGVSVENQARADERIHFLTDVPAAVRFVSVEPMLGPVNLDHVNSAYREGESVILRCEHALDRLHWVICGCESGHGRRPFHPWWARELRDQCIAAGVPFFLKQIPARDGGITHMPALDGRVWDQCP